MLQYPTDATRVRVGPVTSPGAHLKFNVSFDPKSKI